MVLFWVTSGLNIQDSDQQITWELATDFKIYGTLSWELNFIADLMETRSMQEKVLGMPMRDYLV